MKSDAGFFSTSYSGRRGASIAIDPSDGSPVSYFDRVGYDLEYAYRASNDDSWTITADIDGTSYYMGWSNSIDLDSDGNPHIAYFDWSSDDLEYAYCSASCNSSASWIIETLDSADQVGEYPSIS